MLMIPYISYHFFSNTNQKKYCCLTSILIPCANWIGYSGIFFLSCLLLSVFFHAVNNILLQLIHNGLEKICSIMETINGFSMDFNGWKNRQCFLRCSVFYIISRMWVELLIGFQRNFIFSQKLNTTINVSTSFQVQGP